MTQASSLAPSPTSTRRNSAGPRASAATAAWSFSFAASTRAFECSGSRTSSVRGGVPKLDRVCTANLPSGETW